MHFESGRAICRCSLSSHGICLENEVSSSIVNGLVLIFETALPVVFSTASLNSLFFGTWKLVESSMKSISAARIIILVFVVILFSAKLCLRFDKRSYRLKTGSKYIMLRRMLSATFSIMEHKNEWQCENLHLELERMKSQ